MTFQEEVTLKRLSNLYRYLQNQESAFELTSINYLKEQAKKNVELLVNNITN